MKSNRQTTLFQSWGNQKKEAVKCSAVQETAVKASTSTTNDAIINLCDSFDDDDDILLYQAEETINFDANNGKFDNEEDPDERHRHAGQEAVNEMHEEDHECNISIGAENFTLTQKQTQCTGLPGFDMCAGKLWIYPTNYPVRDYQYNIVQQALFKNTMVTLPTGLGKTFIAAVIMYNFYRWYPQGKVVFMAPTKPLVAQQIEACYNIMGIPQDHTAEMTGSMGPPKREKAWHEKRVFFLTPQVLTNDLSRGSCPAEDVKCLVIDEAHKALGNHAYCQVVRELIKYTENFRVLALSATPGSDIKAVQQVLTNLLISHIEIRTEESIDIKQYSHERKVDKIVVPLGEELTKVKEKYIHIMDVVVSRLKRQGVLYNRDTTSLSKFLILKSREAFRQNPPERLPRSEFGVVEGDFALAMSLYHGYELLQLHGSRSLYNFLVGILTGDKGYGRTKAELTRNADFNELMGMLSGKYSVTANEAGSSTQTAKPFVIGHPKMEKLQTIVLEHFDKFSHQGPSATRVMIFSQYRDSVKEITDMLDVHKPLVKAMCFIGQSSVGKASKGFTQKEQLKVMKQFREGGYNTLVSTCVGEEGLDIGDVDLIICFDAHKSPIRLVQRMGRTGRKREGRIVMLVTQGKEEQIYNQSQYSKKSIHKTILNGARSLHFYQHSPRMVPERLSPKPHKMHITVKDAFKPTKRISTDNKTDQSKIKSLFDNASKKDNKEEILSLEQFQELQDWCVDDVDVPKLPEPEIVCLTKGDNTEVEDELPGPHLSLSEWSLWQNTLQHYEKVGHSEGSKHLVQLMEFVQLQHSLDPDDDPYGLEMASYLNEEDLLKPGELENNPTSILRYCVSKKAKKSDEGMRGKEKNLPKSRRSDALPNFDDDDNKDSDDDLPAFTLSPKEPFEYKKDRARLDNLAEDEDIEDRGENFGKATSSLTSDVLSHDNTSDVGNEVASNYIVKKRVIGSKAKSLEKKMNESVIRKAKKRKRGRHTSDCRTVVELIADNDPNDFDGECNDPDDGKLNVRSLARTEKSQIEEPNISNSNHMELADVLTDVSNETTDETNNYKLCSPPPLEDVVPLVNSLDDTDLGERIDLIKLVDEWEKENCVRQFIVKCNTVSFTDSHSFSGCGPNPGVCSSFKENDLGQMEDYTNRNSVRDSGKLKTFSKSDSPLKLETEASKMEKLVRSESPKNTPLKNNSINNSIIKLNGEQYDEIGLYKSLDSSGIHIKETILPLKDKISNKSKGHVKNLEASFVPSNVLEAVDITSTSSASPTRARVPSSETGSTSSGKIPFTEINHKDDSWLADEMDQELADALKTQRTSLKSLKGLETSTQVTFTQALAYVHSSVGSECDSIDGAQLFQNLKDVKHLENSQIDKKSSQSSTSNLEGRTPSIGDKENAVEQPQSISEEVRSQGFLTRGLSHVISPQKIVQPQNTSECSRNSYDSDVSNDSMEKSPSSKDAIKLPGSFMASFDLGDLSDSDGIDAPQFDLGFDIDEDIIPPSPNATQQSQKSVTNCISQSFSNSLKIGQTRHSLGFNNPNQEKVLCKNMQSGSSKDKQVASVPMKVKKSLTLTLDKKGYNDKTGNISSMPTQKEKTGTKVVCGLKSVQECDMSDEEIVIEENKNNLMQESRFNLKESDNEKNPKFESNTVKQTLILTQEELQHSLSPVAEASFCLMDNDDLGTWFDSEPEEMEKLQNFENAAQICAMSEDKWYENKEKVRDKSKQSPDEINVNKATNKDRNKSSGDPGKETNNGSSYNMAKAKLNKGKIPKDITTPINKFKNRKSVFDVNDFSPDPFNDSFDFASADFTKISPAPLKTNRKPTSLSSSTPRQTHEKGDIIKDFLVKSPVSEQTLHKSKNSSESDSDDSFVVRKKKKAFIIESPCSQVFKDKENIECNNQSLLKTPYQDKTLIGMNTSSDKTKNAGNQQSHRYNALGKGKKLSVRFVGSDDEDFDDTELLNKQNYLLPKSRFRSDNIELSSDEDFDKPPNPNAPRTAKTLSSFGRSGCNKVRRSKNAAGHIPFKHEIENTSPPCKARKKRSSNPFVEEEAELSEDGADEASSDENEEVLDHYEASFIQDSEQLSQSQSLDHTEMQAIYMKSIKSPSAGAARYKLQYDYKNVDVFSQIPEEESQYMEDSFCVGEEDDDWLGGLEEKLEPMEVTIMSPGVSLLKSGRTRRKKGGGKVFETGRERALHQGRMKALDKIKLKIAAKNQAAPKRRLTDDENRKFPKKNRIQVLDDSSPEGKGNKAGNDSSDLTSPEIIKVKKKIKHAILSSSDEEENENKLAKVKPQDHENDQPYDDAGKLTKLKAKISGTSDNQASSHQSDADLLICGTKKSKVNSKAVILVDSKEISGSQDIISDLRFKHGIQVSAAQLPGCDYIISNRMAIERKQWSEFSNGANRAKLSERIQSLSDLYDRPVLIIEKDRVKPGEEKFVKPLHWTKYVDKTIALLMRSEIKVLYTDSQKETAALLADLCQLEKRKGMGITARVDLNADQQNKVKFFATIPKLSYIHALNLSSGFKSVLEFISSSIHMIQTRGQMSENRAICVYKFLRRQFDSSML